VRRGGCWSTYGTNNLRAWYRAYSSPDSCSSVDGFRVSRTD
jgi:hypothetical protein